MKRKLLLLNLLLVLRVGLIVRRLLLALPRASHHDSPYRANGSTLASISCNRANRGASKRTDSSSLYPLAAGTLLRRGRRHVLGGLRRIVAALSLGPGVALAFIFLLLCRGLTICGVNDQLRRNRRGADQRCKHHC